MSKLRITHFPQIPCNPFIVEVNDLKEAKKITDVLAAYDLFQYKEKIKPDYCNSTFLEEYNEEEDVWYTWYDEESGISDINEYFNHIEEIRQYIKERFNGGDNNNNE